jgi:putative transcriptional regulator
VSDRVVEGPDGEQLLAAGRLIVASPVLPDPNFDRTVVLLIAYGDKGALGLVLNRPSETDLRTPLPQWAHLAADPAVLFVGGPVQHQAVICLARSGPGEPGRPEGWQALTTDVGTLDLDTDPAMAGAGLTHVRIFAGYAGWGPGQLDGEVEAGAWWSVPADPDDAFDPHPDQLWETVLRRQAGRLRMVASYPADPRWN